MSTDKGARRCTWCDSPIPLNKLRHILIVSSGQEGPVELAATICARCKREVLNTAQRIAVRAQDERELNPTATGKQA